VDGLQQAFRIGVAGAYKEIDIGGVPGISMPGTASAPTTRYSTPFEFKHSINSRKSLLKGIGVGSFAKVEENVGPFLRGHSGTGKGVRCVRFFEAVKDANDSLHRSNVLCYADEPARGILI